jgi:hypothetical protein
VPPNPEVLPAFIMAGNHLLRNGGVGHGPETIDHGPQTVNGIGPKLTEIGMVFRLQVFVYSPGCLQVDTLPPSRL